MPGCDAMTAAGKLATLGGCAAISALAVWALHQPRSGRTLTRWSASPPRVAAEAIASTPTLWVLAIGVSHYQRADFDLQFADADARAVASALERPSNRSLYGNINTLILANAEVTRESILDSFERFLAHAGPDDVVVIFLAGHGVQDRASRSYYFLPFNANDENLVTAGLRMSDFDEMVRVVRRNVRGMVLMLDTCHAGALRTTSGLLPADDSSARLSVSEGFFLLAASKPGEESKENADLAHGAFTYALLEGLNGAADSDGDGLLTVSDLFGYVAREVPRLSGGGQHPYHKMEGTDLVLAAVKPGANVALAPATPTVDVRSGPTVASRSVNTIGVMEFHDLRAEPQNDWIGKAVRIALNTELSKVRALRVYSPEAIDRNADPRHPDQLAIAQRLGIGTLLTGSFHVVGNTIRIDAQIIDTATGVEKSSDSVEGQVDDFFALQKRLVLNMLRRLPVEVSVEEGQSIQNPSNTSVNAYRLLLEAEGVVDEPSSRPRPHATSPASGPHSRADRWRHWWWFDSTALAVEPSPSAGDADVTAFLEAYRRAHEQKDLDRLASLYVSFSVRQRDALQAYLDSAVDLVVEITDVTIEHLGDRVSVSYTRRDRFVDRESDKPTRVEVRLTKTLVRDGGAWKIAERR